MTTDLQQTFVVELYYRTEAVRQLEWLLCEAQDPDVCEQLQQQIEAARTEVDPLIWVVLIAGWDTDGLLEIPLVVATPPASDADRAEHLFQQLMQRTHRADVVH